MEKQFSSLLIGAEVAEGYQAGRSGQPFKANPHEAATAEADAWETGWRKGADVWAWLSVAGHLRR